MNKKSENKLTDKQEQFCQEYVKDWNGTRAYKRAGYECGTEETFNSNASRLLRNDKVKQRIDELRKEIAENNELTIGRVLDEYKKIAFLDTKKLFDKDGKLISVNELDNDVTHAISSVEINTTKILSNDSDGSTVNLYSF